MLREHIRSRYPESYATNHSQIYLPASMHLRQTDITPELCQVNIAHNTTDYKLQMVNGNARK